MARPIRKRSHIERGVVEVVSRKGLHAATIQDIAEAARVSPGLLYRYWNNRDDLAADVYREHALSLLGRLSACAATVSDPWDKLRVMLHEFLKFADERPVILRFLLLSQHELNRKMPEGRGVYALVLRLVQEGMSKRRFRRMDAGLAVYLALGVALQPVIGSFYGHVSVPLSAHAAEVYGALRRMLAVEAK